MSEQDINTALKWLDVLYDNVPDGVCQQTDDEAEAAYNYLHRFIGVQK